MAGCVLQTVVQLRSGLAVVVKWRFRVQPLLYLLCFLRIYTLASLFKFLCDNGLGGLEVVLSWEEGVLQV